MVLNNLKEKFEKNNEVKFKLFSMEYLIQKMDNKVIVYPLLYPSRKSIYPTLTEALNYYTIYNESIIENINRITLL